MADRTALTAIGSSGARQCQQDRRGERQQSNVPAAPDRLAPTRSARLPAGRRRSRPDAENFGGEGLFLTPPHIIRSPRRRARGKSPKTSTPTPWQVLGSLPAQNWAAVGSASRQGLSL